MKDQIRIGIIGVGRWGINYLRTFNELENCSVRWICATKEATLKDALAKVKIKSKIEATADYIKILEDKDVDAVAIASNGSTHYKFAKEALQSSKHVLVEKPLAFHSKDVKELIKISRKKNKKLMVGHLHLFNPAIQKIKEDMKSGLFGNISYIYSFGSGNGPVRQDMSALWDFFPHDVSILLYLLEKMPLTVSANGAAYIRKGIEDIVTMNLKFPKNIFAIATGSWMYPLKKRDLVIVSDKLYAVFDDYAAADKLKYFVIKDNKYVIPKLNNLRPLTEQLKHFVNCIVNDKTPLTDGYEGLKVVSILEAAQKSLNSNGAVVGIKV